MQKSTKMVITGVGGQGGIFLVNILVEAALFANLTVASSEIHGLTQRGGSVNAGLTFGENTYGFVEAGGADFLIGLEPLEAQRCLPYLNKHSKVVIDHNQYIPYSVKSGMSKYPNTRLFVEYLRNNVAQVIFVSEVNHQEGAILRSLFILGKASLLQDFPVSSACIEKAIEKVAREDFKEKGINIFQIGRTHG